MKSRPIVLRFRIGDPTQRREEALPRVDGHEPEPEAVPHRRLHAFVFVRTQNAVVHEHTDQAIAHGLLREHCGDRRIHAAAERAQNPPGGPDACADPLDGFVHETTRGPVAARAGFGELTHW